MAKRSRAVRRVAKVKPNSAVCTPLPILTDIILVYEQQVDGFEFSKGKRKASMKQPAVRNSLSEKPAAQAPPPEPPAAPREEVNPKPTQKKSRRKLPTTPEREEKVVRRSKRISDENAAQTSPQRPAHAKSHANTERSPSPEQVQPVTIEKKRKQGANGIEEEKVKRFVLNFADTPVIDRNKQMRKSSAEGHRRSSTGMRGRRASSLMGEGRGNGKFVALVYFFFFFGARVVVYRTTEEFGTFPSRKTSSMQWKVAAHCLENEDAQPRLSAFRFDTILVKSFANLLFSPQPYLMRKSQLQNSSNTSQQICPNPDECAVY